MVFKKFSGCTDSLTDTQEYRMPVLTVTEAWKVLKYANKTKNNETKAWFIWPGYRSSLFYSFCSVHVEFTTQNVCHNFYIRTNQNEPISVSQTGMLLVTMMRGSSSWRFALAVTLLLWNCWLGNSGLWLTRLHSADCRLTHSYQYS